MARAANIRRDGGHHSRTEIGRGLYDASLVGAAGNLTRRRVHVLFVHSEDARLPDEIQRERQHAVRPGSGDPNPTTKPWNQRQYKHEHMDDRGSARAGTE